LGELALRRVQAGIEATAGLAVAATRKVYGSFEVSRDQPRRYAIEDRGIFPEKMRANARLVMAGYKCEADLTSEDLPWWLDQVLKGGVTPVALGTGTWKWLYVPDQSSQTLKTRTFEWGDDSIAYRAPFGLADSLDVAVGLDDAVRLTVNGFVADWYPAGLAGAGGWAGFTGSLTDRNVETVMGWQQRLFVDPGAGPIGTTWVQGRFVSSALAWRNQNRRKFFGDGSPVFTGVGRGRRQTQAGLVVEAFDTALVADLFNTNPGQIGGDVILPVERAVRLMLIGSEIAGSNLGTTTAATINPGAIVSIPTLALPAAIPGGTPISVGGYTFVVAPAGAALSATSIPVISQSIAVAIPVSQAVLLCKGITFDYWGMWDGNPNWGARDTNVTFGLTLQGVYDSTQATDSQVTIYNNQSAAQGIS
jgi:hypothetical protein